MNPISKEQAITALNSVMSYISSNPPSAVNQSSDGIPNTSLPTGGFFGGSDYSVVPVETTTKLYTGPVLGGKKTRSHKKKRHSYSRKSKKGLKNKLKRLFGFKGGNDVVPSFALPPEPPSGGTTNVKAPL